MLSEEIIKLRKKDGLSQQEFADLVGVTRQMVSLWERGVFLPDDEHLQAICRAFDLPKQYFAQAASASESEQEVAVTASSATPAPVCGSDGCPCARCRKFRPKKNNKVVIGILIIALLLCVTILTFVLVAFFAIVFDDNRGYGYARVSSFGIPIADRMILLAVFLVLASGFIVYGIVRSCRKNKSKNKTINKE